MDYQMENAMQQENQTTGQAPSGQKQSPNNMATASLVMGILAVVTCCCYYGSFIFGGLGILFAVLSRTEDRMRGHAKTGLILSIAGIVLVAVFWGGMIALSFWGESPLGDSPIQNLPVVPDITQPGLDNILTIFRRIPTGGGI